MNKSINQHIMHKFVHNPHQIEGLANCLRMQMTKSAGCVPGAFARSQRSSGIELLN